MLLLGVGGQSDLVGFIMYKTDLTDKFSDR